MKCVILIHRDEFESVEETEFVNYALKCTEHIVSYFKKCNYHHDKFFKFENDIDKKVTLMMIFDIRYSMHESLKYSLIS